jgi:hypothetical protein
MARRVEAMSSERTKQAASERRFMNDLASGRCA